MSERNSTGTREWPQPELARRWPDAFPRVRGYCPKGCGQTLFLGSGGHVTCSWIACPDPCAADDLLWRAAR